MNSYYHIKFAQGSKIIDGKETIFAEKIIEAMHIHQAVELVCGDWRWSSCVGIFPQYVFSDRDGKWAMVKEVNEQDFDDELI
jgi:hypothetical protein